MRVFIIDCRAAGIFACLTIFQDNLFVVSWEPLHVGAAGIAVCNAIDIIRQSLGRTISENLDFPCERVIFCLKVLDLDILPVYLLFKLFHLYPFPQISSYRKEPPETAILIH
ncbi:hypothetical protein Dda_7095 [Drechslerella dactyloides]|uniref:Uncharacterized protein n=1 Tax=Drechslerella dactyloides TaxID=74499 RepID=A0AAD6NG13_DREDA|nr:hypothetical protein Dda_7095 [Drechslerella dactyloides]